MHLNDLIGKEPANASAVSLAPAPTPGLSQEAMALLKEASQDPHGHLMYMRHLGGVIIQTNGKHMIPSDSRRDIAIWEEALNQLARVGLLVSRGTKGNLYEVTARGFEIADSL